MKLNLGCGYRKLGGYVNIDIREKFNPDLCLNIEEGLPYEDNSVSEIRADDCLEHIHQPKVIFVMEEIWRVLKNGGKFFVQTPSTCGRGAFQDPTHVSYWNANSILYYSDKVHRDLYDIKANFRVISLFDFPTNKEMKVIHTHAELEAIK